MKPFFSIRVEYNPADSEDQSHRDGYAVRTVVARQNNYDPDDGESESDAANRAFHDDHEEVVSAIVRAMNFLDGSLVQCGYYDFLEDLLFELANRGNGGLERNVIDLAKFAVDGCDDEFLDSLQALIDGERKKAIPESET